MEKDLLKKYKVFEIGEESELTAISFVEFPAVESNYIALSKEPMKYITLEKEDKHIVYGCALRANFPIYRYDKVRNLEYFIKFSPKAIEKLSRDYMLNKIDNWTLDHNRDTNGISIIESWIKEDDKFDKSIALGLDNVEIGSWFIGAYVSNEDTWKSIKEGKWKGFSVEAMCQLVEENFEINIEMNDKENLEKVEINESFWEKLKSIIADALTIPATNEEEAAEVAEEVVEDIKTDTEVEPEVKEEEVEMSETEEVELEKEEEVEEVNLQSVVDELNQKIEDLNAQLEDLKKENLKLSKQPSVKPINSKGEVTEGSNFDRMLSIMNGSAFRK